MIKHLTTIVITLSVLTIIVLLGIRGVLPPAPEHLEQTIARKQVEAYRCRVCNPHTNICPPSESLNQRPDDNADNFSCVITKKFSDKHILGFETKSLRLRQVTRDDIDTIYEYARKPIVAQRTVWPAHRSKLETIELVDRWLHAYEKYLVAPWGVEEKKSGKLIGTAGYSAMYSSEPRIVTSYAISDTAWGNGYELEIERALIEFACVYIKCIRVEALARCDDQFTPTILAQSGMSREGDEPDYKRVNGEYICMHRHAVLTRDIADQLSDSILKA